MMSHDIVGLLDAVECAVVLFDRTQRVIHRNAAADVLLARGATVDAVLSPVSGSEDVTDWRIEVERLLNGDGRKEYAGVVYGAGTETPRRLDLRMSALRGPDGDVVGGVLAATDVSPTQRFEQQLAELERFANSGKLVARVAHELNNPLDGILRYINLSLRVLERNETAKAAEYLTECRKGLMRMVQIIGDLLVYSRTPRDEGEPSTINTIVEEAVRSMEGAACDSGVVITANFRNEGMPSMRGTKLYQVCCNLIKNALSAMPGGGMLTVTTAVVQSTVVLRFEDTGVGLPEDAEKVFEPFFTTRSDEGGTGLGLPICREFVEHAGGTITAERCEGGGAMFTVRIPIAACENHQGDRVADYAATDRKNER